MKDKELAELVMKWEKIDDEVAQKGWGGDRDERWDSAKGAMVSVAIDIMSGANEKKKDTEASELKIANGYGSDGIDGIGISVHPASGRDKGFVTMRMLRSESCKAREQATFPIKLYFDDLCAILSVLDGIEASVLIERNAPEVPSSRQLAVNHRICGDPADHGYSCLLSDISAESGRLAHDSVGYVIGYRQALGLREVIRHAMLLVGCGNPADMRKAGE